MYRSLQSTQFDCADKLFLCFMKELKEPLLWVGAVIFFVVFNDISVFILTTIFKIIGVIIGLFIIILIASVIREYFKNFKFRIFRRKNNGKYFLLYGSNKRIKSTIETELIPVINVDYKMIYTKRGRVETELADHEWQYLLMKTNAVKYPRLIKIVDKEVKVESFYNEVYRLKMQEVSKEVYKKDVLIKLNRIKNEQIKH